MIMIYVKGYLTYRKMIPEQLVELPENGATLRELLAQLGIENPEDLSAIMANDLREKRRASIAVLVNGCHSTHLPEGLDTLLQDGDRVSIFPPIAGG